MADALDRRLTDQAGRDAVAGEVARLPLAEAASLAAAALEAKRRLKLREPASSSVFWASLKAALRARLTTVDGSADAARVGELATVLWALDRTEATYEALLAAAVALPEGRGVLPAGLAREAHSRGPTGAVLRALDRAVRSSSPEVLGERAGPLVACLLRGDLLEAAAGLAACGWGERELGRLAEALSRATGLEPLYDGPRLQAEVAWLLAAPPGEALRRWLASVEPPGRRLPPRLPLTLDELRAFAELLGADLDEDDPASIAIDRAGDTLAETLERHLAEAGGEELAWRGRQVDIRRFLPFDEVEVLGCDATGDTLFVDPRRRTRAGPPPVVRYCHDQLLTGELEANGVHELAARTILSQWAGGSSRWARPDIQALARTPVALDDAQ